MAVSLVALVVAVLISIASYHLFERKILALKMWSRKKASLNGPGKN